MKKRILFILITLLLILPINANATSISSVEMYKVGEQTVGNTFSVTFYMKFNDLKMATSDTEGLYMAGVEFSFDESVLVLTGISSNHFDSVVYKDNESGHHAVISIVNSENDVSNRCIDKFLYCSDYMVTLQFYVKETTQTSTSITAHEYAAGVFKVNNDGTYDVEDLKDIYLTKNDVQNIKINQATKEVVSPPKSIVEDKKPEITNQQISPSNNHNKSSDSDDILKSSNNSLKSLTIKDYEINFKKDKYTYKLTLPEKVNELYVTAEVEDSKSSYVITGADNLKENNDKVRIIVTAEDGDKVTYNILINREIKEKNTDSSTNKIINKLNKVVYIILGVIVLIIIICIMISLHNKKEIKKLLKKEKQ